MEFKQGNIFDANTEAIVNPVNCVGVMGKGLALQFKQRYPGNFRVYKLACETQELMIGKMLTTETQTPGTPKYIINFPTKNHWKQNSRVQDIELGLINLVTEIHRLEITSIAIPALGCGNGGLQWSTVKPLIVSAFHQLPNIKVICFDYAQHKVFEP